MEYIHLQFNLKSVYGVSLAVMLEVLYVGAIIGEGAA